MKKNKKVILGIIAAFLVFVGGAAWFLLGSTANTKDEKKLESYGENSRTKWEFTITDLTESYSDEQIEQMKTDAQELIDRYSGIMFNFNSSIADYTAALLECCVPEDVSGSTRSESEAQYTTFMKMGVESTYQSFTPYSMVINDNTEVPTVVINGLSKINYKSAAVPADEYEVCTKFVIEKRNDRWLVYKNQYTTIYEAGTVKAYSSDNGNTITFSGKRVGYFK